ncbi:MAG TPA: hypothetical protein GX391_06030 [Firmicutes bacterium]|nr:hypothetical protein [Bacillota bacterium]
MEYMSLMLAVQEVEAILLQKVRQKRPFALIRINDGENRVLGLDLFFDRKKLPPWFRYTGVERFDEKIRQALIRSIKEADMVGLPTPDGFAFRPLAEKVLRHFHLSPKLICPGNINRFLLKRKIIEKMVKSRRVLLLGLTMSKVKGAFQRMDARIVAVEPVHGFADLPRVMQKLRVIPDYDIALVAAGIPGKPLCTHIRKTYGKIAVDIGHVPELLLFPNKPYHQIIKNWLKTYPAHKGKPRQRLQAKPR